MLGEVRVAYTEEMQVDKDSDEEDVEWSRDRDFVVEEAKIREEEGSLAEGEMTELNEMVTDLNSAYVDLEARMDQANDTVEKNETRLDILEEWMATMNNNHVEEVKASIDEHEEKNDALTKKNKARLDALEQWRQTEKESLENMKASIESTQQARIEKWETRILEQERRGQEQQTRVEEAYDAANEIKSMLVDEQKRSSGAHDSANARIADVARRVDSVRIECAQSIAELLASCTEQIAQARQRMEKDDRAREAKWEAERSVLAQKMTEMEQRLSELKEREEERDTAMRQRLRDQEKRVHDVINNASRKFDEMQRKYASETDTRVREILDVWSNERVAARALTQMMKGGEDTQLTNVAEDVWRPGKLKAKLLAEGKTGQPIAERGGIMLRKDMAESVRLAAVDGVRGEWFTHNYKGNVPVDDDYNEEEASQRVKWVRKQVSGIVEDVGNWTADEMETWCQWTVPEDTEYVDRLVLVVRLDGKKLFKKKKGTDRGWINLAIVPVKYKSRSQEYRWRSLANAFFNVPRAALAGLDWRQARVITLPRLIA